MSYCSDISVEKQKFIDEKKRRIQEKLVAAQTRLGTGTNNAKTTVSEMAFMYVDSNIQMQSVCLCESNVNVLYDVLFVLTFL